MTADLARLMAVQQWLYGEARLLDARRYDLWLGLLHPDIRYRVPDRAWVQQKVPADFTTWAVEAELSPARGLALIDEDMAALRTRIGRLQTGMGWAETPPSLSRRLVSNVMIDAVKGDALHVVSNLCLSKVRRDERTLFTAERRDVLVAEASDYRLRERYVVLDEVVLGSENLSLLF